MLDILIAISDTIKHKLVICQSPPNKNGINILTQAYFTYVNGYRAVWLVTLKGILKRVTPGSGDRHKSPDCVVSR